jgi:pimeloyl-ACP methyl ester carboxylesterase
MKNLFLAIIGILLFNQINAQDIAGNWQGSIAAGGANLRLVFNIKKTSDTSYIATFDSPDQKAFGIACSKTYKLKDSLFIGMAIVNGGYKGLWDGKDGISGTFKQGAFLTMLNMTRVMASNNFEPVKELVRPQTPKPPFGYYSEDVEYNNADKSLHYGATFTRPNGDRKYPAVIIISGSGTQDRDGTLFGHKLYWVLADYLTKNGIAVLRVDDRGAGKSSVGNNKSAVTSVDFSYDVEASLNYLENRNDVDKKHLGLIGHSEGGIIAPMVAARRRDVNFIVLWGAPVAGGAKVLTEQKGDAIREMGVDSIAVDAFNDLNLQIYDQFASSASKEILDQKIVTVFDAWKKAHSAKVLSALWPNGTIAPEDLFANYNSIYDTVWLRFFITYNPAKDLENVKCSVLAIDGSKDTQVRAKANLAAIKKILTKSGNKHFEVKELPGLNHLLQTANTGAVSEYEKIEETMSPEAMNIISDWIKIHIK